MSAVKGRGIIRGLHELLVDHFDAMHAMKDSDLVERHPFHVVGEKWRCRRVWNLLFIESFEMRVIKGDHAVFP